jgi:hypothetical protein
MKVISIDVGIKNLAYCLIEVSDANANAGANANANVNANANANFKIIQWDVLNLCGNDSHKCNIKTIVKKNKKEVEERLCDKKATHLKKGANANVNGANANVNGANTDALYICSTHLKKLHPDTVSIKTVKKAKNALLLEIAKKYNISVDTSIHTKKQIVDLLVKYIEDNFYHEIGNVSANQMDLISIGISIRDLFSSKLPIGEIDKIIIENQISPIANRMKSIQGMIAQFFIMNKKTDIHFISSANKLKYFLDGKKTEYGERKKLSIDITTSILSSHNNTNLSVFNNSKKKDDLADSFLQGLWYLVHNKYISIDTKEIVSQLKI